MAKKRKKRVTDIRRQSWIILRLTIPTALILLGGILIAFKFTQVSERNINGTVAILDRSIQTESDMVSAFIEYAGKYRSGGIRLATKRIKQDHDANIEDIRKSIPLIQDTVKDMFIIVYILIGAMILQFIFLIFAVIKITNGIYGPAIVMERILRDALNGKRPDKSKLRKRDELKTLFAEIYKICEIAVPVIKRRIDRENKKEKEQVENNLNQG